MCLILRQVGEACNNALLCGLNLYCERVTPKQEPTHLICPEGVSQFQDDRLVRSGVGGGVKDKDKIEDERIPVIPLVLNAPGTPHHPVP